MPYKKMKVEINQEKAVLKSPHGNEIFRGFQHFFFFFEQRGRNTHPVLKNKLLITLLTKKATVDSCFYLMSFFCSRIPSRDHITCGYQSA